MTLELTDDGYEKLENKIQQIESLAWNGTSDIEPETMAQKFRQIISETRKFRQMLKDILLMVPEQAEGEHPNE